MDSLVAGLVQRAFGEDREANLRACEQGAREARDGGARLIVFPELHASLYFPQCERPEFFDLAEPVPGPTTERFAALARELESVLILSLFEKRAAGLYHNTLVALDCDGSIAGLYRKTHIPHDPGFCEKYYFTPGDQALTPIATRGAGPIGALVCWDQWFPEAARLLALRGARLLIYPTAIAWDPDDPADLHACELDAWLTIQRAHAIANAVPVLAVNRVGLERIAGGPPQGARFWGSSFACGPQGEWLARASADREETLIATLDFSRTERVRRVWPFLRDRRLDLYDGLLQRYHE